MRLGKGECVMSRPLKCGCQPVIGSGVLTVVRCAIHQLQNGRDPRWENIYASKGPYNHVHEEDNAESICYLCSCIHYRLDVYYKGGHYWSWQIIDSVDFNEVNVDFEIDKWIWQEMIAIVDHKMRKISIDE